MIIRKIVVGLVAAAAILAASGVMVIAAAYALFALARDQLGLGPAWAAAAVCAAAAVLIGLVALIASAQFNGPRRKAARGAASSSAGMLDQLFDLVRERPIVSAGALIAAAAVAVRNPAVLASVVQMLLNHKRPPKAR